MISTIALKLGGWGPSFAIARCHELALVLDLRAVRLCARSKPIVDDTFMSMPGPPQSEPPRCPGHTSHVFGQRQQLVVQRAEDAARALLLVDREVGPGDVADEQRVAGEHGPRLVAARGVDQHERGVLGAVARACAARAPRSAPSSSSQPSSNGSCS